MRNLIPALLILSLSTCKNASMEPASLVILGGNIISLDSSYTHPEAIAIRDGKITALGDSNDIKKWIGDSTQVIRLNAETVIPGLIEGHGHFIKLGEQRMNIDLLDTRTYQEVIEKVAERVDETPEGHWIEGRGWHQEKWIQSPGKTVEGFPVHDTLSAVSPGNPVMLKHASGHALLANAKAMELAGITDNTPDPAGGHIVRDENGKATGIFEENAADLIEDSLDAWHTSLGPEAVQAHFNKAVELAGKECWRNGITTFHDAALTLDEIDRLKELNKAGQLPLRLYVMIWEPWESLKSKLADYYQANPEGWLTVRAIKQYYDGALGSRGALMKEPYNDDPDNTGKYTLDTTEYRKLAELAIQHGFQFNTHAIGDRANHEVLNLYQKMFEANPDKTDLRWRIEHAQHLLPEDIDRFAQLGVIASMQSIHCTSDASYVIARLGEARAKAGAYVWRKLLDAGATVMEGTDVPVERIDPWANMYAAVTRSVGDSAVFFPDQCKTIEEELDAYTKVNAYGGFEEDYKGTLTPGKLADITIIDRNPLTSTPKEVRDTKVLYTIIGGEIKYQAK